MKTKFTKSYIRENRGCYSLERVESLSFINFKKITINDILDSEINFRDKVWVVYTICDLEYTERSSLFENIKNKLPLEYGYLVWSPRGGSWHAVSALPGSEQLVVLEEIKAFFAK